MTSVAHNEARRSGVLAKTGREAGAQSRQPMIRRASRGTTATIAAIATALFTTVLLTLVIMLVLALIVSLASGTVAALPPTPVPNPPQESPPLTGTLSVQAPAQGSIVNITTNVTYGQDSGQALNCNITDNGVVIATDAVAANRTDSVSLRPGPHALNITCWNWTVDPVRTLVSPNIVFIAVNQSGGATPTVFITRPVNGSTQPLLALVGYSHTASTALNCTLYVNGSVSNAAAATNLVGEKNTTLAFTPGDYMLVASCWNATLAPISSAAVVFTAQASTAQTPTNVTMLYPGNEALASLNVTYVHNAATAANCTVYMDGTAITGATLASPNRQYAPSFDSVPLGDHTFKVTCTNGTWSDTETQETTVVTSIDDYDLTVTPSTAYPGTNITVNATFDAAYQTVTVDVTDPDGNVDTFNATTTLQMELRVGYLIPTDATLGQYNITAYELSNGSAVKSAIFTVAARTPEIHTLWPNITTGTPFWIYGSQFLADDNITINIIGSGTYTAQTYTNDQGSFGFLYKGVLPPRLYSIVAESNVDSSVAQTNITILDILATTNQTWKPANGTNPPMNPTNNPPTSDSPPTPPVSNTPSNDFASPVDNNSPTATPSIPPLDQNPSKTGGPWLWLAPLILIVVLGGIFAYLVMNGSIDVSSADAFKESVGALFGGKPAAKNGIGSGMDAGGLGIAHNALIDPAQAQTIKSFIYGERSKGFDDLTIRSALIGKGWDKSEVDRIFDDLYREQSAQ